MAKAKSNKFLKTYSKIGVFVILVVSVAVIVLAALAAVTKAPENGDAVLYNGFEVAFGKKIDGGSFSVGSITVGASSVINFSFGALCAYFLPIVGAIICLLLVALSKKKMVHALGGAVAFILFVVAAVLAFIMPNITSVTLSGGIGSLGGATVTKFVDAGFSLGVGAILGGVLNIVGALASILFTASKR